MQIQLHTHDQHTLNAYVAGPEDAQRSIVVIQEIFGVNDHMRHVTDQFAAQGYRAICPALFDRLESGVELDYDSAGVQRGMALRNRITDEQALMDIEAAALSVAVSSDVLPVIVGYCWGGTLAWLAASRSPLFTAASCWYGGGIAKTKDEEPHIPVQMHFGLHDKSIPAHDIEAIHAAQPGVAIYTYADAGHGFGCDQRSSFHADSAALAQERTLAFFDTVLNSPAA